MKIESLNPEIIEQFEYKTLLPSNNKASDVYLPIIRGVISGLPDYLDAIIVTSDLQGIVLENEKEELLGYVLAEFLKLFIKIEFPNLKTDKIGIFLCGDLFATLETRGGLGDVREVWNKFNSNFKWVIGIAGNHDSFGNKNEVEEFKSKENIYYLEREIREVDNLKVAGISGIIGKPEKPNRIQENEYLKTLEKLLTKNPELFLLHQTPDLPDKDISGNEKIRNILEKGNNTLVFCGHNHWNYPLIELKNGTQVLNADSRVIILINKKDDNKELTKI